MSTEHKTIHQVLADVMRDVQGVAKRDQNKAQGFNFRGIDAVVNAVGPAFRQHGVIVVPDVQSVNSGTIPLNSGKSASRIELVVSYRFYGPLGDFIEATVAAESFDSGDKATAKAMSVAFRTALLQTLALPTDERDPDHDTYERGSVERMTRIEPAAPELPGLAEFKQRFQNWNNNPTTRRAFVTEQLGRPVASLNQISSDELVTLNNALDAQIALEAPFTE